MDAKPPKPYPDFPLFPHATKRWAKKIRGKLHYFGRWADPDAALAKYLDQRDDLQAGRTPKMTPGDTTGFTMRELVNRFLTSKQYRVRSGELSQRMFADYHQVCGRLLDELGRDRLVEELRPEDFDKLRASLADGVGPVTLANLIRRTRTVFKFAFDADLVDRPIKLGPGFKPPSRKTLRADRQAKPLRLFEAEDLKRILGAAGPALRAMILLGLNAGYGNSDCSRLLKASIAWESGWLDAPRSKTAVPRRCKLWPETLAALRIAIDRRPKSKREETDGLVFLTKYGVPFVRTGSTGGPIDGISQEFGKLMVSLGLNRENLTFYSLRHTLETIGSEGRDQHALDVIMGHAPHSSDMSAVYRERIDDKRLEAITDHVRAWLWPPEKKPAPKRAAKK